jgi:GPH family glycoside/pentoside/hexuronide:cation symporter
VTPQYLKYYFNVGEGKVWWFLDGISLVSTTGSIAFIIGVFLTGFFSKRFGKRNSLMALTLLNGVTIMLMYFIPRDGYNTLLILNVFGNLVAGPTPALVWAIYTDVADYGEWKSGRRVTGMAFSAAMFAQKLGISLGGWICGMVLGAVGFDPKETPSDQVIESFRLIACVLPGVLAVANGFVLIWYRLSDEQVDEIAEELQKRRGSD